MTKQTSDSNQGTFLLGVGAQKAGTSWLHDQLQRRTDCNFGFLKEYHIHDAMTIPEMAHYRDKKGSLFKPRTWLRQRFFKDPNRYYNYFARLLSHAQIKVTGDITPSYCSLRSITLKTILSEFKARQIDVRPVFLMRDPVERILSSMRMKLRKEGRLNPVDEISALKELTRTKPKRIAIRSDYVHTLDALQDAFELDNCFIGFYETIFCKENYTRLCHFLGLDYQEPAWNKKINQSATTSLMPRELIDELRHWQAQTLQGVARHLPNTNLKKIWLTAYPEQSQ